ncbi:MAG: DUF4831 family protein [Bacteroidales bacterium]|nr:DUF4831 family protein [Candidatus Cacconaster merdequi]
MNRFSILVALFLMVVAGYQSNAQSVVYALPQTVVNVQVTFEKSVFTPGPYAKFAQKYLGNVPRTAALTSYTVKSIKMIPCVEADPSARYVTTLSDKSSASFLSLCSQGLIALDGSFTGNVVSTNLNSVNSSELFSGQDPTGNLATVTTTLYKSVMTESGDFERVPVQQSQTVEKSLEKKAEETAGIILNLRQKRIDIVTGDTDATFSGEAMKSAIDEIDKLEEQYMRLFYGVTSVFEEEKVFTVVPKNGVKNYTVCKVGNVSLTMEISAEPLSSVQTESASKSKSGGTVYYRIPATASCRIMEGSQAIADGRLIVYQFGERVAFPL